MANLDVDELMDAVKTAVGGIVKKDATSIKGFSESQLTMLAKQAAFISEAQLNGTFDGNDELRDHFTNNLEAITRNFVNTLRGLAVISIEKITNEVIKVVWSALDKATGVAFPRP